MRRLGLFFLVPVFWFTVFHDAAIARVRYYQPAAIQIDGWGRCITGRGDRWWFIKCPDRRGIYHEWSPILWYPG